MPGVITHYLMSKASADLIGDSAVLNCLKQHGDVFYLGAQGPDILYFALGNKDLNNLGERMHGEGVAGFFAECLNRIRKTASHEGRDEIIAYMAGYICHFALDVRAYPYIYYKAGFEGEDGRVEGESALRRHFLEATIDCVLLRNLEDKTPYALNIPGIISVGAKKRMLIGKFLSETVASSYGVFIYPEDYAKAMKDMAFVYRIFRDRTGTRRRIAMALGKVSDGMRTVASMMHCSPVKRLDYLNEQRAAWHYPWDDTIDINASFMDLFNSAADDSRIYVNAFGKALNRQLDDKIALSILGGKNFSTGLESTVKFLYYNIEFEKLKEE
ncbi:MAG: zinc dependent phospholipase C family protein [Clostridiales bacterium]|jgi:hypothetical protein|nr:zinc dependent phospholipase C family protein [Clostridiales bacterium]